MDFMARKTRVQLGCGYVLAAAISGPVYAGEREADLSWEERRLFEPTVSQLKQEQRGGVFIYDGLEYATVTRAMDENFERIDNMMFVRVKHPPPPGEDEPVVEDDGCD